MLSGWLYHVVKAEILLTHANSSLGETSTQISVKEYFDVIVFQCWEGWSWKSFQNSRFFFGKLQPMHILLPSTALKMHLLFQVLYWRGLHQCTEESSDGICCWMGSSGIHVHCIAWRTARGYTSAVVHSTSLHSHLGKTGGLWHTNSLDLLILLARHSLTTASTRSWCARQRRSAARLCRQSVSAGSEGLVGSCMLLCGVYSDR